TASRSARPPAAASARPRSALPRSCATTSRTAMSAPRGWRVTMAATSRSSATDSPEAAAAVDMHDLAGHVAGSIGDEELRDGGDALGVADATEQRAFGDLAQRLLVVVDGHRGSGRSRADRVDADAAWRKRARKRAGEPDDRSFRRHVGGAAAAVAADAADIDR